MEPHETARVYDKIASHWADPAFDASNAIAQHERALRLLEHPGTAIDIGCGANGRIIALLRSRGFEVEGLDLSDRMLAYARKVHPTVRFHHADICVWEFPRTYDFISAWDSVWHVPLERQPAVLRKLCAALSPGGVLIFTSGAVDAPGHVTNPCFGEPLYHAAPGIPELLRLIDASACACRHMERDDAPGLHLYLIVQKPPLA